MKRFGAIVIFILTVTIGITAYGKVRAEEEPKVNLIFNIASLTDEEFKEVGTKSLENVSNEDFKNIQLMLEVEYSNKIENRKIVLPSIKEIVISKYEDRYWFGEGNTQDNKLENFAKYNEKIVFFSNGLDENDIEEIFKTAVIKISWTTSNGKVKEETLRLEDYIKFK